MDKPKSAAKPVSLHPLSFYAALEYLVKVKPLKQRKPTRSRKRSRRRSTP
ncbi:MAG: hypothetical protein V3R98_03360 [Alphaproteobacteria bacterium]